MTRLTAAWKLPTLIQEQCAGGAAFPVRVEIVTAGSVVLIPMCTIAGEIEFMQRQRRPSNVKS
jgi:hypothetical protein